MLSDLRSIHGSNKDVFGLLEMFLEIIGLAQRCTKSLEQASL